MKQHRMLAYLICAVLLSVLVTGLAACKKQTVKTTPPPVTSEPKVAQKPKPVWPLTGLPADENAPLDRYPLSVKIENLRSVRPQSGLNSADIVYETEVEGGITRFNCLFDSQIPDEVGPVRSARLSDLWVVPQYQALLFYSGANGQVKSGLQERGLTKMDVDAASSLYHRVKGKRAPHNLFLSLSKAYDKAKAIGVATSGEGMRPGPVFGALASDETTSSGVSIDIPFSPLSRAAWTWDSASGHYLRSTDGAVHTDALTGAQVWADNVVIMWATYTQQGKVDAAGNVTYDVTLGGSGKAAVFRGGLRIDGTWSATASEPPTFSDAAGKPIPLTPGRTWFEVPRDSVAIVSQ
ncbi:MAG: DUF3048 domain-containing protein [Actinomycetia bacterium]|nr:DUF3048 domain-containing protein [Actinomycetes bacterium]